MRHSRCLPPDRYLQLCSADSLNSMHALTCLASLMITDVDIFKAAMRSFVVA